MTDDRDDSHALSGWMLLPAGIVLYVLSLGPVARFAEMNSIVPGSMAGRMVGIVYWPLGVVATWIPPVARLVEWYVGLFLP